MWSHTSHTLLWDARVYALLEETGLVQYLSKGGRGREINEKEDFPFAVTLT